MMAHLRDFLRDCADVGVEAKLQRDSKHKVYQLTNRHGAVMTYTVARGGSGDPRTSKNQRRDLRRFSEEQP
jgi:hypothetical protein